MSGKNMVAVAKPTVVYTEVTMCYRNLLARFVESCCYWMFRLRRPTRASDIGQSPTLLQEGDRTVIGGAGYVNDTYKRPDSAGTGNIPT
ncbi:hypothetical protein [Methylococcus mesophilus]|uniref:hypothetical protein n=1 Tax=Methylococcus mesophilus TaxID=2993564 RepID=UPI00224B68A2|nr:hypothetical protein [Methylococcus mesophilus]UZR31080.1 hypothetical protein OOT43_07235 [Methylococcus mesophilus]